MVSDERVGSRGRQKYATDTDAIRLSGINASEAGSSPTFRFPVVGLQYTIIPHTIPSSQAAVPVSILPPQSGSKDIERCFLIAIEGNREDVQSWIAPLQVLILSKFKAAKRLCRSNFLAVGR